MAESSDSGANHRARLEQYEREAVEWLAAQTTQHNPSALYDALRKLPYLQDLGGHHAEYVYQSEQTLTTTFCLGGSELPLPLPASPAPTCACEDITGLQVEKIYLSGSVRECTDVRLFAEEVSDIDVMFQLGPMRISAPDKVPSPPGAQAQVSSAERSPGLTVTQERTSHPGFTVLHHQRLASCHHEDTLPVDPRRVVGLMDSLRKHMTSNEACQTGPSVATTIKDVFSDEKSIDLVACVRCPNWPSEDFATRPKPSGYPDTELVARLCNTPAFLVPVGFKGSLTELLEWRLSFSKHEYIIYRLMNFEQRLCLTTLKHCRAVVGEVAKPLKSYYLKTALMWLAESRPADQWTLDTMHDSLLLVLRYLDVCLSRDYLPCYFWPEVNLLASRTAAEKAELVAAVKQLRDRLLPAVLALLADWLGRPVTTLAEDLLVSRRLMTDDEFVTATAYNVSREVRKGDWRSLNVLKDLALNGKIRPYGKLTRFPLCSALALGIEAGREFRQRARENRGCRDANNLIGILQPILELTEQIRRPRSNADSWMTQQ